MTRRSLTEGLTAAQIEADAEVLAVALGLEYEAIALYEGAAGIDAIWSATGAHPNAPTFLAVAGEFMAHHKLHATDLEDALKSIGHEDKIPAKPGDEIFVPYGGKDAVQALTGLDGLKTILQVAAERETNAGNVYFAKSQLAGGFNSRALADVSGGLAFDEIAHAGVLNAAALSIGVTAVTAANIAPYGAPKATPFTDIRK